ncbi:acyltransferase [Salinisphaera sp. SPP-AMP-43]|uniref:acyltransferase family protein n=1 Tax=Salinisphaera sp. SPP-AMP-43 TaxID=3121288 RepID=UPI003C6E9819
MKGQLGYIHALRGVAILLIVAAHTNSFAPHDNNAVEHIYRALLREGTALFVLISGFLFQHLHASYTTLGFWRSKLRNVALPYLIMSIPGILLYVAVLPTHSRIDLAALHEHSVLYQIGYFLITGAHLLPLWFIPVLLMIFACYPLLRYLADSSLLKYVAVACLVSLVFTQRATDNIGPLVSFMHFLPVYIVGMALHRYWDHWIEHAAGYGLGLVGMFIVTTALACVYRDPYAYSSLAILAKLILFVLICAQCHHVDFVALSNRSRLLRLFNYLAALSFGIYFVHGYVASAIARSPLVFPVDNGGLAVALGIANVAVVTAISVGLVEAVRYTTKSYSRMIVGA